jgi:hypothetical protein
MLVCKRVDKTKSYINWFGVHWWIKGRRHCRTSFYGGINSAKGCKGGEHYCVGRTTIHISTINSIASYIGVDNGRSMTKGDGDGVAWNKSGNKEKMRNFRQNYTFRKRY